MIEFNIAGMFRKGLQNEYPQVIVFWKLVCVETTFQIDTISPRSRGGSVDRLTDERSRRKKESGEIHFWNYLILWRIGYEHFENHVKT